MVTASYHSNQFEFLRSAFPTSWQVKRHQFCVPVANVMLWEFEDAQVWWDYSDGHIDEVERESIRTPWLCLQNRNLKKKFFYVKPFFSPAHCEAHLKLIEPHGRLLTCPKWSFYWSSMIFLGTEVDVPTLRKQRLTAQVGKEIAFFGKSTIPDDYAREANTCWLPRLNCEVSNADAKMFGLEPSESRIIKTDRGAALAEAQKKWGKRLTITYGLSGIEYLERLTGVDGAAPAFCFQPHGVGLRHAIFECMALGIPSVIPECGYIDDVIRSCNIVYSGELPDLPARDTKLEEACRKAYDAHCTPTAIVQNVLKQLVEGGVAEAGSYLIV